MYPPEPSQPHTQRESDLVVDLAAVLKIADRLLTDLENAVEGLDPEEAAQIRSDRDTLVAVRKAHF